MSKKKENKVLILGASGLIGSNLYDYLKIKKISVFGTYYKNKNKKLIKFNFLKDRLSNLKIINSVTHAIFVSGLSNKLDQVEKDYKAENELNYKKTRDLMNECYKRNIKVVYVSSDAVFDGKKGNYTENSIRKPINKYGSIKLKIEKFIQRKLDKYLILRISKVISFRKKDISILSDTIDHLKKNKVSFFSSDEIFSPIFINDFCEKVLYLISNNKSGIYHLNSIKRTSRYEIAQKISSFFKLNIKPKKCKINSINLLARRGLNMNLNSSKYDSISYKKEKSFEFHLKKLRINV